MQWKYLTATIEPILVSLDVVDSPTNKVQHYCNDHADQYPHYVLVVTPRQHLCCDKGRLLHEEVAPALSRFLKKLRQLIDLLFVH